MYKIINVENNEVVEVESNKERAELLLFHYDTEENPHRLETEQKPNYLLD